MLSALFFEGKDPRDVADEQRLDVSHVYRLRRSAVARIRGWLGLSSLGAPETDAIKSEG